MNLRTLTQIFSIRDIRNALLGFFVVFGGLGLAGITFWAHETGNARLAEIAAVASLAFIILILIFVIPPLARSASAEASQMDLPFEFTTGGAIYMALLVIVAFAAWNTGNNLLFLVLSFLTSAFIVGFIVGNVCLKGLDVKMRFPDAIFAGEATPLIVSLHNRKRFFPTFSVIAEVRGKERETSLLLAEIKAIIPAKLAEKLIRPPVVKHTLDYFLFVGRRDSVENRTEHIFEDRGRFIIKDFELSTRFPFGFFRHRRRLSAQEAEIVIFPKITPVEPEILFLPYESGKRVLAMRGTGQDLLALRDYQPQDDLRHVDWKATARSRNIIVREFAAEDQRRVSIAFSSRLRKTKDEQSKSLRKRIEEEQKTPRASESLKRFEKGIGHAASLLAYFTDEQAEVRLIIDDQPGEFGIGKSHLNECLKRLSLLDPTFIGDDIPEVWDQAIDEIFTEHENCYTFVLAADVENSVLDAVSQRSRVLEF